MKESFILFPVVNIPFGLLLYSGDSNWTANIEWDISLLLGLGPIPRIKIWSQTAKSLDFWGRQNIKWIWKGFIYFVVVLFIKNRFFLTYSLSQWVSPPWTFPNTSHTLLSLYMLPLFLPFKKSCLPRENNQIWQNRIQ